MGHPQDCYLGGKGGPPACNLVPMELQHCHRGALHEAGHALVAIALGRQLQEVSIIPDKEGSGYTWRNVRSGSGLEALEEIAISIAGEEAAYLWNPGWITNSDDDHNKVIGISLRHFGSHDVGTTALVRGCVKKYLVAARDTLALVAQELWARKVLAGDDATALINRANPPHESLRRCLKAVLNDLATEQP
jgi:hypothetical protein